MSLHIPDFRLIFIQNLHPPEISAPPVSQPPPLRTEVGLLEGGGGGCTLCVYIDTAQNTFQKVYIKFSNPQAGWKAMTISHFSKQHSQVGIENKETEIPIKKGSKFPSIKRTPFSSSMSIWEGPRLKFESRCWFWFEKTNRVKYILQSVEWNV